MAGDQQAVYLTLVTPVSFTSFIQQQRERANDEQFNDDEARDEYQRWAFIDREPGDFDVNDPIQYWHKHRHQYPKLSRMALDFLTIQSMSAEYERLFSSAGRLLDDSRSSLGITIVAFSMTLRSWYRAGIIRDIDPIFLSITEEVQRRGLEAAGYEEARERATRWLREHLGADADDQQHRVSQVLIDNTNTSTSFTFPQLHQAVLDESLELVPPPRFSKKLEMAQRQYKTHVTARFTCDHCAAGSVWSSGMVGIEIRGSHDNQYYSAIVYNQRCKRCKGLGSMELDEGTYIERVSYRLKKWAGVKVEAPDYSNKATPPHLSDLCEACKLGRCKIGLKTRGESAIF
ncbi:hypothetical protein PG994_015232 [Apiospora phragmitis]|uniref:3CxxC-type domain-containing protein n=1 Tax=Apiospora phragmitis TaxID=2905665 RepID=A0ABR1SQY0_9PEZI